MPRKPLYAAFAAYLLVILTACTTIGVPAPQTFNERLAAAYSTVTAARDTTATLLTSGKLTAADAQNVNTQCDNLRSALDVARTLRITDPVEADSRLSATIAALTALQSYLESRQK